MTKALKLVAVVASFAPNDEVTEPHVLTPQVDVEVVVERLFAPLCLCDGINLKGGLCEVIIVICRSY